MQQPPNEAAWSEQEAIRRQKLDALQGAQQDPYALTRYPRSHGSRQIAEQFDAFDGQEVCIAGRMTSRRIMGKASFAHVLDGDGSIQIYAKRDDLGEEAYAAFKDMDIGDYLGVRGTVFRTQKGEISVHATEVTLLAKALKPLPEKFHGLKDQDLRYRQRYLDMIVNPEVREVFRKRSQMLTAIREFLDNRGFLEVDTPILHTLETGAAARPFITHHNTLDIDMYLRIETELHLKRLIVGGFEKVYEVGRIFRNEGMDSRHNPEFTSVELYQAYADYHDIMRLVEELFSAAKSEFKHL
ncbi:MAG TPA: OB-fold nucleic acid binding domain-containing protein, partial [Clostridia bacterium]|nr:OB-fold nucleic acid binding domain-containing protein [Clostridia bacterium]